MGESLGVSRPDPADYMVRAAATDVGRAYKRRLLDSLDVRQGQTALDVGCGPGTDLASLAARVGETGTVIGVDRDPAMLAEAQRRASGSSTVELREGDAHALPVETGSVDRAKVDRVLMHVTEPDAVLSQLHRVVRPGGLVALAEPDWDTLVVDAEDLETSRAFTRYTTSDVVRHATIGRALARYADQAGFTVRTVSGTTAVFTDVESADHTLGLGRTMQKAIDAGCVDEDRGRRWFASLSEGPFFACFSLLTVIGSRRPSARAEAAVGVEHLPVHP